VADSAETVTGNLRRASTVLRNRLARPRVRSNLLSALALLALAVLELRWNGVVVLTLLPFWLAVHLLVEACKIAFREVPAQALLVRSRKARLAMLAISLLVGLGFIALDRMSIAGQPLLAGPALPDVRASTSQTAGSNVAGHGNRFLVLDVEVASRLGAPLQNIYYRDFRLETEHGRLGPDSSATRDLPGACADLDVAAWSSSRCRLVFEVPEDATAARLHVEEFGRKARSGDIDLRRLPPADIPRVDLSARVSAWPVEQRTGRRTLRMFVRAEALAGAAPVALERLRLQGQAGAWIAYDRSGERLARTGSPC
jgi:hypothetical protein